MTNDMGTSLQLIFVLYTTREFVYSMENTLSSYIRRNGRKSKEKDWKMKNYWLFICFLASGHGTVFEQQWHSWKLAHGKVYSGLPEERLRRQIWEDNVDKIREHNNKVTDTFSLAINQFADLVSNTYLLH